MKYSVGETCSKDGGGGKYTKVVIENCKENDKE
jgi:hypothetical protein